MKHIMLAAGMAGLMQTTAFCAEETQDQAIDIESRKQSVANLETHIAQREQRLTEWSKDIVELDARIEKRVEELVKMLAGLRDSKESRTKVSQIKKDAIEGLERGIDLYMRKRKEIRELVRTGDQSAMGDLDKFDQRIIKRVEQIAELTKSIPTHEDVQKYDSSGGNYWNGYYNENQRISEEWKQNRRDSTRSDAQRKDTIDALKKALDRLDQRRRSLKDMLDNRKLTDSERSLYTTELGQVDAYQDQINQQLQDVTTSSGGGGRAIGRDQAHDVEDLIADARADLREDVMRLFRSYDQFVRGRSYIEGLKQNLAARKEWLEKNAKGTGSKP